MVDSEKRWEVVPPPEKKVGDGRLASKIGGYWEVDTPATPFSVNTTNHLTTNTTNNSCSEYDN